MDFWPFRTFLSKRLLNVNSHYVPSRIQTNPKQFKGVSEPCQRRIRGIQRRIRPITINSEAYHNHARGVSQPYRGVSNNSEAHQNPVIQLKSVNYYRKKFLQICLTGPSELILVFLNKTWWIYSFYLKYL